MTIEWISHTDRTTVQGTVERVRIGKPDDGFFHAWATMRENMESQGFTLFETSAGKFVQQTMGVLVEPPCAKIPCPRPPSFLRDFQKKHFRDLWDVYSAQTSAGDFSDTGTGKTYISIAYALEMERPLFVICPLPAMAKWKTLIKQFRTKCIAVGNYEYFKGENEYGEMDIVYYPARLFRTLSNTFCAVPSRKAFADYKECLDYLFSKTIVRQKHIEEYQERTGKNLRLKCREIRGYKWKLPRNAFLVFDEVHKCKSADSQNMKLLVAAKPYVTEVLTATPGITPRDFKALGFVLGLHNYYDFDIWTEEHGCRKIFTDGEKPKFVGWDYKKNSNGLESLNKSLFPAHAARMRVAEIPDFPKTQITAECFSAKEAPEIERAYRECVAECESQIAAGRMLAVTSVLRYRMLVEKLKVNLFCSLIEEANEAGWSVPLFLNFRETLSLMKDRFPGTPMVYGGQKEAERNDGIKSFFNNESRNIFLMSEAGGASIDLHDIHGGHARHSFISPTYNPYTLKQVFGRVHRDGAKTLSKQTLVYVAETQEEKVCKKVMEKIQAFAKVNGDELQAGDLIEDGFMRILPAKALSTPQG